MLSSEESVSTKLQRIAIKAGKDKRCQFTSLFHLMNKALLLECFAQLKGNAASGIDNVTKADYAIKLDENLESPKVRGQALHLTFEVNNHVLTFAIKVRNLLENQK